PCGSGKKYKKCCLTSNEAEEFKYRRQLNLEAGLVQRLTEFALKVHGIEVLHQAWCEFNDAEVEMFAPDSPIQAIFMPWFLFAWLFDVNEDEEDSTPLTNSLLFATTHLEQLTEEELEYLEAANDARYSLCEVVQTKPGIGLVLRDLFTQNEFEIREHSASQSLHRGH